MTDEKREQKAHSDADPPGGHDPEALADAARKFNVDTESDSHDDDPTGGHDPKALDEAARRMKTKG